VAAGERHGVRVIAGCEFSVASPWGELHVLGYFLPLDSTDISDFLVGRREDRRRRAGMMVARLNGLGVELDMADVEAVADGAALGRPHVARALLRRRAVADVGEAFDRYLGWGRPAFEPKQLPSMQDLAAVVHRAGGILSAAHLKDRATRTALSKLQTAGLDAVEVRHPRHGAELRSRIGALAEALGLLKTGGSDWHGDSLSGLQHATIGSQQVPGDWLDQLESARDARRTSAEG
jgi:predicted metal-dependent phosphoesterase TrpH